MFPVPNSRPPIEDLIPVAISIAVYSEVEQTRSDIPVIYFGNNLISLGHISPETTI